MGMYRSVTTVEESESSSSCLLSGVGVAERTFVFGRMEMCSADRIWAAYFWREGGFLGRRLGEEAIWWIVMLEDDFEMTGVGVGAY